MLTNYRELRKLVKLHRELSRESRKMTGEAKAYRKQLAEEYQIRALTLAGRVKTD